MTDWAAKEQRAKVFAAYGSLAIPVCIALATVAININQQRQSAAETCRDKTLKFFDEAAAALDKLQQLDKAGQSIKADITDPQAIALELLTESCQRGGVEVPSGVRTAIERLYAYSPEESTRESLAASAKRADASVAPDRLLAVPASASGVAMSNTGVVRVFLHISKESQRPAAKLLEGNLEQQLLYGRKIDVPGIELVPGGSRSSLRCLKQADCAKAPGLEAMIKQLFPQLSLDISNLSGRYEHEPGVKAGTYEVWLGTDAQITSGAG